MALRGNALFIYPILVTQILDVWYDVETPNKSLQQPCKVALEHFLLIFLYMSTDFVFFYSPIYVSYDSCYESLGNTILGGRCCTSPEIGDVCRFMTAILSVLYILDETDR